MKKTFITLALLAVLGTLAVSCQKENIIDETSVVEENDVTYIHFDPYEFDKEFQCIKE